jgi:hypothetical protein
VFAGNIPRRDATTLAGGPGFDLNIPENCTFEPPLEFIDQVTLSPPEGYKDVVRHHHHSAGEYSASRNELEPDDNIFVPQTVCRQKHNSGLCSQSTVLNQIHEIKTSKLSQNVVM